jgi:nitrogen PTS system EIIA component
MIVGKIVLTDHIVPELHVVLKIAVRDKIACLKTFVDIVCELNGISEKKKAMYSAILKRERLSTTGVGNGIAVPHALCDSPYPYIVLGVLENAIDFGALDDLPVDLVLMIFAAGQREDKGVLHLRILGRFTQLLKSKNHCCAIRNAISLQQCSIVLQNAFGCSIVQEEIFSKTA